MVQRVRRKHRQKHKGRRRALRHRLQHNVAVRNDPCSEETEAALQNRIRNSLVAQLLYPQCIQEEAQEAHVDLVLFRVALLVCLPRGSHRRTRTFERNACILQERERVNFLSVPMLNACCLLVCFAVSLMHVYQA